MTIAFLNIVSQFDFLSKFTMCVATTNTFFKRNKATSENTLTHTTKQKQ